jgi:polyisoprenoid-binding protein YceI
VVEQNELKQYKSLIFVSWLMLGHFGFVNVASAEYQVNSSNATVTFSGEHAGMRFEGKFETWSARISLGDDSNNDERSIHADFDLRSAKTGDSIYDETLPEGDWFDVDNHPEGSFVSEQILINDKGYAVSGTLTLRGKMLPSNFNLVREGERLKAQLPINRLDYGIGVESDPEAEWVSEFIQLSIDIPVQIK